MRRALISLAVLFVAACGGGDQASEPAPTTTPPDTAVPDGENPPAESQQPEGVDLAIVNGNVVTMDPGQPATTAVAVDDEKIVAIGDAVAEMIGPETTVIDLAGRTMLPGFVDAHSHFFQAGIDGGSGADIQIEALRNGITTTAEMGTTPEILAQLRQWDEEGALRVRTSAYLLYTDACGELQGDWWRDYPPTREQGEMLRIGGVKVFSDGGACNVPAASFAYRDGSQGDLYFSVDELLAILTTIDEAGYQAAVHALGDRAVDTVLSAYERLLPDGENPKRHRIEHTTLVRPEHRDRYGRSGVVPVFFGSYATCLLLDVDRPYQFVTPEEFIEWEWPWRQLIDANPDTAFAWQADYPALSAELGRTLEGFVTRAEGDCQPTPDMAAGAITVDEALNLMTLGGAYALDRDTEVGSISEGKFADFVVLSHDPYSVDPAQLREVTAVMTIVGGTVEYQATPG